MVELLVTLAIFVAFASGVFLTLAQQAFRGRTLNRFQDPHACPYEQDTYSDVVMRESAIQAKIISSINARGGLAYKWDSGRRGVPDLIVILEGRVVFLEVKTATGKTHSLQNRVAAKFAKLGHEVHVVRSVEEALAACDL